MHLAQVVWGAGWGDIPGVWLTRGRPRLDGCHVRVHQGSLVFSDTRTGASLLTCPSGLARAAGVCEQLAVHLNEAGFQRQSAHGTRPGTSSPAATGPGAFGTEAWAHTGQALSCVCRTHSMAADSFGEWTVKNFPPALSLGRWQGRH